MSDEPFDPLDMEPWTECYQCGGEGSVSSCEEEWACMDPEGGCDLCTRRCEICEGKGGWKTPEPVTTHDHAVGE